jgi:hypothetical protein
MNATAHQEVVSPGISIERFEACDIEPDRVDRDEPWHVFRHRNADLVTGAKELLSSYYSEAYLFSERARERFVLPDKLASNESL